MAEEKWLVSHGCIKHRNSAPFPLGLPSHEVPKTSTISPYHHLLTQRSPTRVVCGEDGGGSSDGRLHFGRRLSNFVLKIVSTSAKSPTNDNNARHETASTAVPTDENMPYSPNWLMETPATGSKSLARLTQVIGFDKQIPLTEGVLGSSAESSIPEMPEVDIEDRHNQVKAMPQFCRTNSVFNAPRRLSGRIMAHDSSRLGCYSESASAASFGALWNKTSSGQIRRESQSPLELQGLQSLGPGAGRLEQRLQQLRDQAACLVEALQALHRDYMACKQRFLIFHPFKRIFELEEAIKRAIKVVNAVKEMKIEARKLSLSPGDPDKRYEIHRPFLTESYTFPSLVIKREKTALSF
ncbi:unnamed protein product [Protopolystoma xenopodis]|uniref:Uncharacterized protein n=1 Tax=Protopolystoma xenopodis TaxID=117903 RepID=A0A3S5FBU2_9PLAT|nr:unnamed protein product [Protopolystoma xenopodis]